MPEITLPVQKAEKVIKPPVKSLQLGDGYEQTFQNAIADMEEWNVTTPPMDDTDANSLEDLLNGLNGDVFTWTPPFSDPGTYRLNSKITRTMVSYMRSTLQFSLKKALIISCTPRSLVFESSDIAIFSLLEIENIDQGFGGSTAPDASIELVSSGGNPASHGIVRLDFGGNLGSGVRGHWLSNFSYTPTHPDEVITIDYQEDVKYYTGNYLHVGQSVYLLVYQSGVKHLEFIAGFAGANYESEWTTKSKSNILLSDMGVSIIPYVPLYFGFARLNGHTLSMDDLFYSRVGIDNWKVTIHVTCG